MDLVRLDAGVPAWLQETAAPPPYSDAHMKDLHHLDGALIWLPRGQGRSATRRSLLVIIPMMHPCNLVILNLTLTTLNPWMNTTS